MAATPGAGGDLVLLPDKSDSPAVGSTPPEPPLPLAWLPSTSAALSLRLASLDAAIVYTTGSLPGCDTSLVRAHKAQDSNFFLIPCKQLSPSSSAVSFRPSQLDESASQRCMEH